MWTVVFTKAAQKDAVKLRQAGLKEKTETLLDLLVQDPFTSPPRFEKLVGNLAGAYSRRITIQHRLVYQILIEQKTIKILRMWSHYE